MDPLSIALVAIDRAWEEFRSAPLINTQLGIPVDRLPDLSEAAALATSARAHEVLALIEAVDASALPHDIATTLEVARVAMARRCKAGEWYWLVFDPLEVGSYAMFAPTAYGGGFLLNSLNGVLAQHTFTGAGDLDRYLGLIEDYGRIVRQLDERTRGQAERGIHLPAAQLGQAVELVTRLHKGAARTLVPATGRLERAGGTDAVELIAKRVAASVEKSFETMLSWLTAPERIAAAPESVGLAQYPDGRDVYDELVRIHTTLPLTAEEVHERGQSRLAVIHEQLHEILDVGGVDHAVQEHMSHLAENPAWRADGPAAIAAVFNRYIARIAPHIESVFRMKPAATGDVAPLPSAMSGSMTFGYYDPPSPARPVGRYLFNSENLSQIALASVAAVNYHELIPGHHFHLASQRENPTLHPLRRNASFNAFSEGWAEYAAGLAGELGMYQEPEEQFGKLVMEAFLTTRLVVDTGMNALGWTLEQGRDFMREKALVSEQEVLTESVRYSCDIPGQSLGYKIGEMFLLDLRTRMSEALGDRFDIRDFHDAVLSPGGLPLSLVETNVDRAISAVLGKSE